MAGRGQGQRQEAGSSPLGAGDDPPTCSVEAHRANFTLRPGPLAPPAVAGDADQRLLAELGPGAMIDVSRVAGDG